MIVLKKKQPFSLKDVFCTDVGLSLSNLNDNSSISFDMSVLQSFGIQHVVWTTKPFTKTLATNLPLTEKNITKEIISTYWLDEAFEEFVQRHSLEAYREKYVLLALKDVSSVRALKGPLFEVRARGYEPIILHYSSLSAKLRRPAIQYLCDLGCLFQLDLMALTGAYGTHIKAKAESWLSYGLFSILTTGIRDVEDASRLKKLTLSPMTASALEDTIKRHERLTRILTV